MPISSRSHGIFPLLASATLAGCATTEPAPRVVFQDVLISTPVYCVTRDQIPDEPPKIGSQLTGDAARDIGPIAISASELRKAFRIARALLVACIKPEGN